MPKASVELTPEQLKKQEERRLKRAAKEQQQAAAQADAPPLVAQAEDPRGQVLEREWVRLDDAQPAETAHGQRVVIKTWNLLAQTLVRRKLFPTSDCLKSGQREHMLYRELLHPRADVLCLQEVDRLDKIQPFLEAAGYGTVYASGPLKKHGCLVAFRADKYERAGAQVVLYDSAERGASHRTKNIGSLVALHERGLADRGLVVATTHLFWHPAYAYERTRQAGILLRELSAFRRSLGHESWPGLLAGDFNFAPDDAAYALLVGAALLPGHAPALARSRVVHASIDPTVPITTKKLIGAPATDGADAPPAADAANADAGGEGEGEDAVGGGDVEDEGEAAGDPDRAITNARAARPDDGLFTTSELAALYASAGAPVQSAYDAAQRRSLGARGCGPRLEIPADRLGHHEPEWTSYTHYWKTVLDYIFILDSSSNHAKGKVAGYLKTPSTEELHPGIPMKGVTSSDHVSLTAEIVWEM